MKEDDVNLASSTMGSEGKTTAESMGIVISYSLRVKLNCGTLGGELQTDVPFKLMNPAPGEWRSPPSGRVIIIQLTNLIDAIRHR